MWEDTHSTLYDWCLINNIQPLGIDETTEDSFMTQEINYDEFKEYLKNGNYKENSTPIKPEKYLELRMYGLVPYNLSPMQQGIQYDHAKDVYKVEYGNDKDFNTFLREWKTTIILNGGTSNEGHMVKQGFREMLYVGSMQQHLADLVANKVKTSTFYEPDLNSMLTAIVFLVDERVFNKKVYPDYIPPIMEQADPKVVTTEEVLKWNEENKAQYNKWVRMIGGPKNEFLREFLKDKRLA